MILKKLLTKPNTAICCGCFKRTSSLNLGKTRFYTVFLVNTPKRSRLVPPRKHSFLDGKVPSETNKLVNRTLVTYGGLEWSWKLTRFGGVVLDLSPTLSLDKDRGIFLEEFSERLNEWIRKGRRGIWVKIPVEHSAVVADLYSIGFKLHHAKQNYIMMKKWLPIDEEDKMPLYAFHTVGVSGLVLNEETREALVVQDKGKTQMWKFPGGFSEPNEDIGDTAIREVKEETGIYSEFKSLLAFRQQHTMAFDQSDLYFICHLHPLSFNITICPKEIMKCEWLPLEHLQTTDEATPMTKLVASLAIKGLDDEFDDVCISPHEMTSWVPPYDKKFKVFHRPFKC
ncbi:nucleoside diphosphate-linked moiety X motif 6-like [Rhopilema esculentum]|uniref:nucleoside diphosphate-linked moiety X motif 6-like n=1 Tax=Rhopilema esculentum TaxID=499914 RepID=UPI0031D4F5D1